MDDKGRKRDLRHLATNKKIYWGNGQHITKTHREAARQAWIDAGSPTVDYALEVDVVFYTSRAADVDNRLRLIKPLIDGLCQDGIVPDDNYTHIKRYTIEQRISAEFKDTPQVLLILQPYIVRQSLVPPTSSLLQGLCISNS